MRTALARLLIPSMTNNRDNFPARVREILAERVAYRCARPGCGRLTIGPHSQSDKSLRIGRACHICAASPNGPRYDSRQTPEERISIANGIWLCANCSDLIDKDEGSYPAAVLLDWKERAEADTLAWLIKAPVATHSKSAPTATDRIAAARLLDGAFDALAGGGFSDRLNWRHVDRQSLEIARRSIRDAEILDPSSLTLPLLKAICLLATGFPERALELLETATSAGHKIEVAQLKSRCFADLGRLADSRSVLESIANEPRAPAAVRYNIGSALLQEGRLDDAEDSLLAATQQDPTYGEAFQLLARIAHRRGDLTSSAGYSAKGYRLLSGDFSAAYDYALCLLEVGSLDEADKVPRATRRALS